MLSLDEAFLEALMAADPTGKVATRVYRGSLLLGAGSFKTEAISVLRTPTGSKYARQTIRRAADRNLYAVRLGDFAETCLERFNTFERKSFWRSLAMRDTDVTVVSELSPTVVRAMDKHLRLHPRYLGVVSPDLGNPLHRELLIDQLFKDIYIQQGKVFARKDVSGELHTVFSGVRKFSGGKLRALEYEAFEKLAPVFLVNAQPSGRGVLTQAKLEKLEKLNVHQRVLDSLHGSGLAAKLPFDLDLAKLPISSDEVSVEARKLTNYLLDANGSGASKAKFFLIQLQIGPEDWKFLHAQLVDGLSKLLLEEVQIKDEYGVRFSARFPVKGLNGATATIHTVWMVRASERASLITAYPAEKDTALEAKAQEPLVIVGLPEGKDKWEAIHALAHSVGSRAMEDCVPMPMVIHGEVIMEGRIGNAVVLLRNGRSSYARWVKLIGAGFTSHPSGVAIQAQGAGRSVDKAEAYANGYAKVLGRNGIECIVMRSAT